MGRPTHAVRARSALPALPAEAEEIIDGIERGEILGASRTTRLLNDVFCLLVDSATATTGPELAGQLQLWGDYLVATRGALTPAVGNAIRIVLGGLKDAGESAKIEDIREIVHARRDEFNARSLENVAAIAAYGSNLLWDGAKVMAYDYSSTVNAVLKQAAADNKRLHIVIPESRSLDGGLPILKDVLSWGHRATFTVDAAVGHEVRACETVLVGVESLSADGGFWNTVGTRSLAILAKYYRKDLYAVSELIKFDTRSTLGIKRSVNRQQLRRLFSSLDDGTKYEGVNFECDDLEFTPRQFVSGYVTEHGVLPPASAVGLCRSLFGEYESST